MDPTETTPQTLPTEPTTAAPARAQQSYALERRLYLLARAELFRGVDRATLERLADLLQVREAAPGELVCRLGDPADAFFIVETGSLSVLSEHEDRSYDLHRLGPGDAFGEIALLRGGLRTASVRADTPASLWQLSTYAFALLRAQSPSLNAAIERLARERDKQADRFAFEEESSRLDMMWPAGGWLRIGRRADNDLVIDARQVSNHHALVERHGNVYRLRDLNSSNGTFVNGTQIGGAVTLHNGDEIWIGDQRLIFDQMQLLHSSEPHGLRLSARELAIRTRDGKRLLEEIALSVLPGELVAIAGGHPAARSALLQALAGLRSPCAGRIDCNGGNLAQTLPRFRNAIGYLPTGTTMHRDLSPRQALRFESRLRLPADSLELERDAAVRAVLDTVALGQAADTRIASLTDEERLRAGVAVELLGGARALFLEQPTAGFAPAAAGRVMLLLRQIAAGGCTVMLTTAAARDLATCDKVLLLTDDGTLAFAGTPARAQEYFATTDLDAVIAQIDEQPAEPWAERFRAAPNYATVLSEQLPAASLKRLPARASRPSFSLPPDFLHQVRLCVQRDAARFLAHPRTAALLLASPIIAALLLLAVIGAHPFALSTAQPRVALAVLFILIVSGVLSGFGIALSRDSDERSVFRRDHSAGLSAASYIAAKASEGAALLLLFELVLIIVLVLGQRLPARGLQIYAPLLLLLWLNAFVALALGLLISVLASRAAWAVRSAAILVLAQIFFMGAIISPPALELPGRWFARLLPATWAFNAAGHLFDLNGLFKHGVAPNAAALLREYDATFSANIALAAVALAVVAALALLCAVFALAWESRRAYR